MPFFGPPLPDPAVFRKVKGSPSPTPIMRAGLEWEVPEGATVLPQEDLKPPSLCTGDLGPPHPSALLPLFVLINAVTYSTRSQHKLQAVLHFS